METAAQQKPPMISVIVPVYKVEPYLSACVNSILAQTYTDFELILVDDGSPDNCGAICDAYAARDPRVRVIHQENRGLSGARNSGMDIAEGEYLTFVDSDDLITCDCLQILLDALLQNDADISCVHFFEIEEHDYQDSVENTSRGNTHVTVLSGPAAVSNIYNGTGVVAINAWGKLIKQELAKSHPFPLGMLHEDQAVIPILLFEAKRVVAVNAECYCYRKRTGSIMQSSFDVRRFDNLEALDKCINYFAEQDNKELVDAAKRTREKVNAMLVVLAESVGAREQIPEKYRMTRMKAVYLCHKYLSNEKYSWYLGQLYPKGAMVHEYMVRIKRIFSIH